MNLSEFRIHFIGVGGIGMSGIAEVLVNMGCTVSGSDLAANSQVERLKALGVKIVVGHDAKNVPRHCDVVVYSSAVKFQNPEMVEARRRHIPIIQRAEMLSELMRLRRGIAIAGTHGKTTTTSMTAAVMLAAQLDPTIVIGGRLDLIKSSASLGKGEWLLAEADESDGSFLRLSPEIAVATNIDNDHLDHYESFEKLRNSFAEFLRKIPFYGLAIVCADDPHLLEISRHFDKRLMTYGFSAGARLRGEILSTQATGAGEPKSMGSMTGGMQQVFRVSLDGRELGSVTLHVPGAHNVLNALAAIAVGLELKMNFEAISEGISSFQGVDRRLQRIGELTFQAGAEPCMVIDDYGHHPTEVEATIAALKSAYPDRRLVVAFQPHRYSRTKTCWDQFLVSFGKADVVGLLDIYSAGEKAEPGITSENLVKEISAKHQGIFYWGGRDAALASYLKLAKGGDIFLTLGAGDVWKLGRKLLEQEKKS